MQIDVKLLQVALDLFADKIIVKQLNGKRPIFPSGFVQLKWCFNCS